MWSLNIVDDWQSTIWILKVALMQNGCIIQVLVHNFFVLLVLYQKTFSPLVTMLFKLCLATYFQKKNLLMARFASNPFQVVYLFSNKKLQFTHTVSMYPWIIYRICSIQLLLCVSVCSSLICLCNGLAVLRAWKVKS